MNAAATYRIVDEPAASRWTHLAVNPLWPLLASMFGGAWLAWPWFVLNGHAIGSPTRWRETAVAAMGFAGSFALVWIFGWAIVAGHIPRTHGWWAWLGITLWKLGVSYWLFVLQGRTFELYEYFGGRVRNGVLVVAAGLFLRDKVLALFGSGMLMVVLG